MRSKSLKQWFKLGLGLLIIWLTITQFHRFLPNEAAKQLFEHTQEKDLDAAALFYTESEKGMKEQYRLQKKRSFQTSN